MRPDDAAQHAPQQPAPQQPAPQQPAPQQHAPQQHAAQQPDALTMAARELAELPDGRSITYYTARDEPGAEPAR